MREYLLISRKFAVSFISFNSRNNCYDNMPLLEQYYLQVDHTINLLVLVGLYFFNTWDHFHPYDGWLLPEPMLWQACSVEMIL